jgi:glutamyl-tRNA reductase
MNLILVGINHRTAPLEVREKLWLSNDEIREFSKLLYTKVLSECFIISTCNRTEVYGVVSPSDGNGADVEQTLNNIFDRLTEFKKTGTLVRRENMYMFSTLQAAKHLLKVSAGVDSMILGDVQILNQVREHFHLAHETQTTGMVLHRLVQTASRVGKRTKHETLITSGAVSVSYAAVELAVKIFADLQSKSVLLLGAGETGELTAKLLVSRGITNFYVANRTRAKAEELTAALGGNVVEWEKVQNEIPNMDIIISSVTAPQYVLTKQQVEQARKGYHEKTLFVIDIGLPRNIDPSVNDIENVFLHDLDSLTHIVDQTLQRRKMEVPRVNGIILEELKEFYEWMDALEVVPTIVDLRSHFEKVREEEVERLAHRFGDKEKELVDTITKRIVNRLLHDPTVGLKDAKEREKDETVRTLDIVRKLFGLKKDNDTYIEPVDNE